MRPPVELSLAPSMLELMTLLHKQELVEYNEAKQQQDFRELLQDELWHAMYGKDPVP